MASSKKQAEGRNKLFMQVKIIIWTFITSGNVTIKKQWEKCD
jgi:hypothetical protein